MRDFIVEHYRSMPLFTHRLSMRPASEVVSLLKCMGVFLPSLAGLDKVIRGCIVEEQLYILTADNLREALGGAGDISIDRVRQNADVYDFCLKWPGEYLATAESDPGDTPYVVVSEPALIEVLTRVGETWGANHARKLVAKVAPDCRLIRLGSVPTEWWPSLADYHLFRATVEKVRTRWNSGFGSRLHRMRRGPGRYLHLTPAPAGHEPGRGRERAPVRGRPPGPR